MPSDNKFNQEKTLVATDVYLKNDNENIAAAEEILPVAIGEISKTIDKIQVTNLTSEGNNNSASENSMLNSNFEAVKVTLSATLDEINNTNDNIQANLMCDKSITIKKRAVTRNSSKQRKVTSNNDECNEFTNLVEKNKNCKSESVNCESLCPSCQLLKIPNAQKVDASFLSKDIFMKILLVIMFFVIFLNYILYVKLVNLEKIANNLIIHGDLTKKV